MLTIGRDIVSIFMRFNPFSYALIEIGSPPSLRDASLLPNDNDDQDLVDMNQAGFR